MNVFGRLIPSWVPLAIMAFLCAVILGQRVQVSNAKAAQSRTAAEFADYRATQAESARLAERSRRDTEQRWDSTVEGVSNEGQKNLDVVRDHAERIAASEQRLQQRVAAFLSAIRRTAADSGIATAGAAATDPAVLLAELFGRARERARLLGKFADDAHTRGQTCERYADGLQPR